MISPHSELLPKRLCQFVCIILALSLLFLVQVAPNSFTYDEPHYIFNIKLLLDKGFGKSFLREMHGPAGPTAALIQSPFAWLAGFGERNLRTSSFILLLLSIFFLSVAAHFLGVKRRYNVAYLFACPGVVLLGGMALTEMAAIMSLCGFLLFFSLILHKENNTGGMPIYSAIIAGILLALAILGRQPYLVLCGSLLVLYIKASRTQRQHLALCFLVSLTLVGGVFWVWGDMVPPAVQKKVGEVNLSFFYGLLSFSYAAIHYAILDFSFLKKYFRSILMLTLVLIIAIGLAILGGSWPLGRHLLAESIVQKMLPSWSHVYYYIFSISAMFSLGIHFFIWLVAKTLKEKDQLNWLFIHLSLVLLLITPARMMFFFSLRYTSIALPLLILVAIRNSPDTYWKAARLLVSGVVGLLMLSAHLY